MDLKTKDMSFTVLDVPVVNDRCDVYLPGS